jgi:hypothetical protein
MRLAWDRDGQGVGFLSPSVRRASPKAEEMDRAACANLQLVGFPPPKRKFRDAYELCHRPETPQPPQKRSSVLSACIGRHVRSRLFLLGKAGQGQKQLIINCPSRTPAGSPLCASLPPFFARSIPFPRSPPLRPNLAHSKMAIDRVPSTPLHLPPSRSMFRRLSRLF